MGRNRSRYRTVASWIDLIACALFLFKYFRLLLVAIQRILVDLLGSSAENHSQRVTRLSLHCLVRLVVVPNKYNKNPTLAIPLTR